MSLSFFCCSQFQSTRSNSNFPKSLNTETRQKKKVKQLVQLHFNTTAKVVRPFAIQGCFSKTYEVTLLTGKEIIVQLRVEPLDRKPFIEAKHLLGLYVLDIGKIEDVELKEAKVWPFYMQRVPGQRGLKKAIALTTTFILSLRPR